MIEAIGIIHECVVCGESEVVDMSGLIEAEEELAKLDEDDE